MPDVSPIDEMVDGASRVRPHWRRLFPAISELGSAELAERGRALDRLLAENGVTSLLPGAEPIRRHLDPIPFILSAREFTTLERGLAQRARLLEHIIADVHGPCTILSEGLVPPALVYGNPGFSRALRASIDQSIGPPNGPFTRLSSGPHQRNLSVYAAELVRGPDGNWHVVADRTEDAAGLAYVAEHRRWLTRAVPEFFQAEQQARRLRPFFELWQDELRRLAPRAGNPSVALLSSGPDDKLWFEHVVLAHELSCTLVEPADVTVRDGVLYLKTLRGLRPVDVLLRRMNGRALDPLEQDCHTGIPGLFDAQRTGQVRIVNAAGTGFAEAPGLAAWMPALSRRFLHEDLLLPDAPVRSLMTAEARAEIFAPRSDWVVRPAADPRGAMWLPAGMTDDARAALAAEIEAQPGSFVATQPLLPSGVPSVGPSGLTPRPLLLRMFLMFDGANWQTLPGGLARALSDEDPVVGRTPLHGLAKDVWVLGEDTIDIAGPASVPTTSLLIRRAPGDLPSRVADNFFWLGRYLERAEAAARLIRTAADWLERPAPTPREIDELHALLTCLHAFELIEPEEVQGASAATRAAVLSRVTAEDGVLRVLLGLISHLTVLLRDRLTNDVHTVMSGGLTDLVRRLRTLPRGRDATRGLAPLSAAMTGVLSFAATVTGLASENMVRGGGRLFLELGRRVERAHAIAIELANVLDQPDAAVHPARLESGLRLALVLRDSVITYRNRYLSTPQPGPVLDLVMADEGNPRALGFQFTAAADLLAELEDQSGQTSGRVIAAVRALGDEVRAMPEAVAAAANPAAAAIALPARLREVAAQVAALSDAVTREYFALLPSMHGLDIAESEPARSAA